MLWLRVGLSFVLVRSGISLESVDVAVAVLNAVGRRTELCNAEIFWIVTSWSGTQAHNIKL